MVYKSTGGLKASGFRLHEDILRCAYHPHENAQNFGDALNVILTAINAQCLLVQLEKLPQAACGRNTEDSWYGMSFTLVEELCCNHLSGTLSQSAFEVLILC